MLQAELRESACNLDFSLAENGYSNQQTTPACYLIKQGIDIIILCSAVKLFRGGKKDTTIGEKCNLDATSRAEGICMQFGFLISREWVRVDHMAIALSKTYRSPIMDTIQSLPQHQQIILCSAVKLFRGGKKDTTIGELSKSYLDICKLTLIPPVGIMELSSMCRVLGDQIEHMKLISQYDTIPVKWQGNSCRREKITAGVRRSWPSDRRETVNSESEGGKRLSVYCSSLSLLSLIFLLFQNPDDARQFMKFLHPDLGIELPERSYGADCRIYSMFVYPAIDGHRKQRLAYVYGLLSDC
ncbi:hypothetical protein TEA_027231 [Camellia sinensis var. sinensis]|uniref:CDP-diacylglycerol--serine O-phosphatidyltransferase n=1 Tax=Camellia sinensis var. sinensis TaxID=542762 RepID=A0A4S4ELG8_CAMSN|nr:hypothetical protein TEA_027231 [Camellia sinensis var. sinensis]